MSTSLRADVAALRDRPHAQVLILGGGINGIATFRDLALQGVDVAIVDAGDFMSGASSASSHMIHGGVRYLENGEFRLVREAVQERNRLLRLAPHYVRPLQTTIPLYSAFSGLVSAPLRFLRHGSGRPQERGAALIKIGLTLYDSFSRDGGRLPRHRFHGGRRSHDELPALDPAVKYTATYWDASVHDPERLGMDLLADALRAGAPPSRDSAQTFALSRSDSRADTRSSANLSPELRARAANYTAAAGLEPGGVILHDRVSGERFAFSADLVVNVTGPWADLTNEALGDETAFMGGTKGSHVVLDHPELLAATGGREIFFEHSDGRIVLIHPLKGRVLVGTTDLEHDMREPAVCTEAEVDYFFDLIGHIFPGIGVDRSHIVHRMSGVRPLPRHGDQAPGFVSRDYRVERRTVAGGAAGTGGSAGAAQRVLTLVGGKLTTFRASAETLADRALAELGAERTVSTRDLPIGGGAGFPVDHREYEAWIARRTDRLPRRRIATLLARYGTRADEVLDFIEQHPGDRPLETEPRYSTGELVWLVRNERVVHLSDLLQRRTALAFSGASPETVAEVARIVAPELGWDEDRTAREIAARR